MAVCRGCVAFWVGRVRGHVSRQPVKKQWWSLSQASEWQLIEQTRPLSSASWALGPPNGLRYQNFKQPALSHPFHHASQPQGAPCSEEEWHSVSVCIVVRWGECEGQRNPGESPLFGQLLSPEAGKPLEFLFPLTTVDGSREDDISVGWRADAPKKEGGAKGEHGSFRRLFEAEGCPAPFMYGSHFYCFHCPATQPRSARGIPSGCAVGLENKPLELSTWLAVSLCSQAERAEGGHNARESEGEEKLALMYERLRLELPSFFLKSHDFTMYSNDVEFINGLLNTHTRGRVAYQLSLSLWRLLCLCYYAEARIEVLKLTKHAEDSTVKARWRIRGLPFHTLLLRFYRKDKSHLYRSYDAFSTFYIGHDGLIHCHKVEKVMQAQPPVLPRVRSLLAGALVALGLQEHRPALNLLPPLLSSLRQPRN